MRDPRFSLDGRGRTRALFLLPLLLVVGAGCASRSAPTELVFVGTSSVAGSEGLYVFEFDRRTATLRQIQSVHDRPGPNFQAVHPSGKFLYSVSRQAFAEGSDHGTVTAYRVEPAAGPLTLINEQSVEGRGPTHVSVDPLGRFVYVSNYSVGNLSVLAVNTDGSLTEAVDVVQHVGASVHPERQASPHLHSIVPSPDGRFVYASDLGIDKIMIYEVDPISGRLSPGRMPHYASAPGSGPRHFAFHPSGKFAYSVEEMSASVTAFSVDTSTGALQPLQRVNLVPEGMEASGSLAADVHSSPDGRFLYVTNRGHDTLIIYAIDQSSGRLTLVGYEPTGGEHSRAFWIDRKGEFVFVANMNSDDVTVFRRNPVMGTLSRASRLQLPSPLCVTQILRQP